MAIASWIVFGASADCRPFEYHDNNFENEAVRDLCENQNDLIKVRRPTGLEYLFLFFVFACA